jgi:hypothetical protein
VSADEGPLNENTRSHVVPAEFSNVQVRPLNDPVVDIRLLDVRPVKTEVYVPRATTDPV